MAISEKLACYTQQAFKNELPQDVVQMVIQAIVDQYGLQIGGSAFPWSKAVYTYIMQYAASIGKSTVTRFNNRISPLQATFLNSTFAHAQDFDDSHLAAITHPGSVVIPAAIAIGEQLECTAVKVLSAITIGMEIMTRLAHSISPVCIAEGHHTPLVVGPFGAAIACGLLLDLTQEQLVHALGICGSYAGGSLEYTLSGGSVKRIHTAIGARAGVEAALLAQQGITGPKTIIEGKKGLWAIFGRDKALPERLFQGLGKDYLLNSLSFKAYNCCYWIHPAIEAFLTLCQQHQLQAHKIKSVTIGLSKIALAHTGQIKIPTDALGAQFSVSFTLALALVKGVPGMWSYSEQALQDKNVLALAEKIDCYVDEEANQRFPQQASCIVTITTHANTLYSIRIKDPKGSPLNPMTTLEIKHKFLNNTRPLLGELTALELYERLSHFDTIEHLTAVRWLLE